MKYVLSEDEKSGKPYTTKSYSFLHSIIHNLIHLCPGNKSITIEIYNAYKKQVETFLEEDILILLKDQDSYILLKNLGIAWGRHKIFTQWMHKLFQTINNILRNIREKQ